MNKYYLHIIISLLFFGCNSFNKPKKPDNLLSKSKISDVLYDMFIINSAKGVNKKLLEKKGIFPEAYILKKHNIDSVQFAESNNYYVYDEDTYKSIITSVKAKINTEKAKYKAELKVIDEKAKIRKDSIRKVNKIRRDSLQKKEYLPIKKKVNKN